MSESASTSSLGSNSSHNKAPGAQLSKQSHQNNIGNHGFGSSSSHFGNSSLDYRSELSKQIMALETDPTLTALEREQRKQGLCVTYSHLSSSLGQMQPFFGTSSTIDSLVGTFVTYTYNRYYYFSLLICFGF